MFREVTREEAITAALQGKEVYQIYEGDRGTNFSDLRDRLDGVLHEKGRFIVDITEEEPEPMDSKSEAGKSKRGRPKKTARKKTDVGKIRALYNAGWPQVKIAEEMGLGAPTISKYVKQFREEDKQ